MTSCDHIQVHQLHTVLVKKRDPHTQVTFLDSIAGVSNDGRALHVVYYNLQCKFLPSTFGPGIH